MPSKLDISYLLQHYSDVLEKDLVSFIQEILPSFFVSKYSTPLNNTCRATLCVFKRITNTFFGRFHDGQCFVTKVLSCISKWDKEPVGIHIAPITIEE